MKMLDMSFNDSYRGEVSVPISAAVKQESNSQLLNRTNGLF